MGATSLRIILVATASMLLCVDVIACGESYVNESGVVTSPDYPGDYGNGTECVWTIETPSEHEAIRLTFTDLDLKESVLCADDFVEVIDGNAENGTSLGQFCGDVIPDVSLMSSSNKLSVRLKSCENASHASFRGFRAEWTTIQPPMCRQSEFYPCKALETAGLCTNKNVRKYCERSCGVSCRADGVWSEWTEWDTCDKSVCGVGVQTRSRSCNNPAPQFGGNDCQGIAAEERNCTATWDLVFKVSSYTMTSAIPLWMGSTSTPATPELTQLDRPSSGHFKCYKVDNWTTLAVDQVKIVFYKGGIETFNMTLNGTASTKTNFFSRGRLQPGSLTDLQGSTPVSHFSFEGISPLRRFYISKSHNNGCSATSGWVIIHDALSSGCSWESVASYPVIRYSPTAHAWASNNHETADYMAIFLSYANEY